MSLRLEWDRDDKVLFSDNIAVRVTKDEMYCFRVFITDKGASVGRYVVPGRLDIYDFDWIPSTNCGIGSRVAYFTDRQTSLYKAVKQLKRDLKKKQVKELLAAAKTKCPRSYLDNLLEALK